MSNANSKEAARQLRELATRLETSDVSLYSYKEYKNKDREGSTSVDMSITCDEPPIHVVHADFRDMEMNTLALWAERHSKCSGNDSTRETQSTSPAEEQEPRLCCGKKPAARYDAVTGRWEMYCPECYSGSLGSTYVKTVARWNEQREREFSENKDKTSKMDLTFCCGRLPAMEYVKDVKGKQFCYRIRCEECGRKVMDCDSFTALTFWNRGTVRR